MGLGIHGGGLASALFFARRGAQVTVTDLRSAAVLEESIDSLHDYPVRYVLERHDEDDFRGRRSRDQESRRRAHLPFPAAAREHGVPIETDLSVFLLPCPQPHHRGDGVQGEIHHRLGDRPRPFPGLPGHAAGGNITVSPLSFLDELAPEAPVVLELSSWQLGDLRGKGILKPAVSVITVILPDHLDKYAGMTEYVEDKKAVFQEQEPEQKAVFNLDDPWQRDFPRETRATAFFVSASPLPRDLCGAWLDGERGVARLAGRGGAPDHGRVLLPGATIA